MEKDLNIFISYRREDTAHAAGRLFDRLSRHFGSDHVFMDIDTVELGDDFVNEIELAVRSCDVMVTLIGQKWLTATNSAGEKRLNDPNDFVHLEIASALDQSVDIVPILLDNTPMPVAKDLPGSLRPLTRRNGIEIGHTRFNSDVDRLIQGIEVIFQERAAKEDEIVTVDRLISERVGVDGIENYQASVLAYDEISKTTRQLIVASVTLGWLISGIIFWVLYDYMYGQNPDMELPLLPSAIGGIMGALVVGISLKRLVSHIQLDILIICSIGWVTGIVVGWSTSFAWGDIAIENGIPIGGALGGLIVGSSTGFLLSRVFLDRKWKDILILSIGWSIAWVIGLIIHNQLFFEYGTSFTIWFFPFLFTTVVVGSLLLWQIGGLGRQ